MCKRQAYWLPVLAVGMLLSPFASGTKEEDKSPAEPDLVPIEIELPEPFFGGAPLDYFSRNLEPPDFRARPPFYAPEGTKNVAAGKPVSSSIPPVHGELKQITDGDKHYERTSLVELPEGLQWVQVDLEREYTLYAILVWHFYEGSRVYFDIVIQVSNDTEFKEGVTTVYNNDIANTTGLGCGKDKEYVEDYRGRLIDTQGVGGRYIRFYSKGNCVDALNHYVEIEVYGLPKPSDTAHREGETETTTESDLVPIEIELPEQFVG